MESADSHAKNEPRILIVEDSPTQAERLKFLLEQNAYRFATARNGREALAAVASQEPVLVISDVVMPEMDGYQLCAALKQDKKFRHIPVILLTSLTDPIDVVKGLECGADNFIFKPYAQEYLLSRIAYALANRRLPEAEGPRQSVEIFFAGQAFLIRSDRSQILNLLLSTYETAVERNRELALARDDLRLLNENLEAKVRERTLALEAEVLERRRAEEEVRRLNAELEQRVRLRTAQLEASNQEMESFSYSVSHDLRAPLRHISGFVGLLGRTLNAKASDAERRYLTTISKSAEQMGRLIDDLLEFSRMGRALLRHELVDFTALVQEVLANLEPEMKDRKIALKIDALPRAKADFSMMRQVFANLLGNAVKYTRRKEQAEIEVGARPGRGEAVFFVRDNGAGFDMRYADKLFGVFQRLHAPDQFEGTGIGLANVRRIIQRHGGRVWAEAQLDAGATFYFSLPAEGEAAK